ncbi:F-box only protein 47-like [Hydractinia symbiolongicarpus]|uniref:F-box only protein 47-like n=1 Tax=Hydractinia symbiolongicarpus TaxID=13093 RepID=UPI0025512854|nr:F-box only protein 47-like [Hydractinia symbiolongicarpus]
MKYTPLISLGSLTLASKDFRNLVLMYVYSKEGSDRVVPAIKGVADADDLASVEYQNESKRCHEHYKQLGIMLKRSTCLFSTRERLAQVGKILDKLRDSHVKICTELGSDLAYSCYGIFLHAFIAGWEDDEKVKAFQAIKGASLLEERIVHVMKAKPGNLSGYERYVRVFCKEIFLNRSCPSDISFWIAQILKPYPICFQARLLYILFGPCDSESENISWEQMTVSSEMAVQDLMELAKGIQVLQDDARGLWSADDLISLFEEMTTIAREWDIENVAILLKFCGDSMCCEVLGNKAVNGRMTELAYLLYYTWQYCSRVNQSSMYIKKEQEWFIALIQHLSKLLPRAKDHTDLINQIFSIYEEGMIDILDDQAHIPVNEYDTIKVFSPWFNHFTTDHAYD